MSRVKVTKKRFAKEVGQRKEWPAVVYFWSFGLAILSYAVGRAVLDGQPHPYHWGVALIGGLAGIPIGWLWFRWRGDVF